MTRQLTAADLIRVAAPKRTMQHPDPARRGHQELDVSSLGCRVVVDKFLDLDRQAVVFRIVEMTPDGGVYWMGLRDEPPTPGEPQQ